MNVTFTTKTGRVLEQAELDALAREAEAGYDLSAVEPRPWRGRPSLGAHHAGASPRINVRLAPEVYEIVLTKAQREGRKVSAIAREALERLADIESTQGPNRRPRMRR